MSDNKTRPTTKSVNKFIAGVENEGRRADAKVILSLMEEITGEKPVMWGESMVGFGRYHYKYESGREGDIFLAGFAPRKANLVIYIMSDMPGYEKLLAKLGKHKSSKACLYLGRLANIDMDVLKRIIEDSIAYTREMEKSQGA